MDSDGWKTVGKNNQNEWPKSKENTKNQWPKSKENTKNQWPKSKENTKNEWPRNKKNFISKSSIPSKPVTNPLKEEIKFNLSKYKKGEINIKELIKWITTKYYELKEINSIKNEKENIQYIKLSLIPLIELFIRIGKTKNVKLSDDKIYSNVNAIDIIINKSEGYSDDNIEIITNFKRLY
jgi:hypothetical protein